MKLPEKLSDCIDVALKDLELVVGDPRYIVDFEKWHVPDSTQFNTQCTVCFAGSVMAKSLGIDPAKDMVPSDFNDHSNARLRACLLYTSPSPRDATLSRMPSSA